MKVYLCLKSKHACHPELTLYHQFHVVAFSHFFYLRKEGMTRGVVSHGANTEYLGKGFLHLRISRIAVWFPRSASSSSGGFYVSRCAFHVSASSWPARTRSSDPRKWLDGLFR
jgi:hypothetical protein